MLINKHGYITAYARATFFHIYHHLWLHSPSSHPTFPIPLLPLGLHPNNTLPNTSSKPPPHQPFQSTDFISSMQFLSHRYIYKHFWKFMFVILFSKMLRKDVAKWYKLMTGLMISRRDFAVTSERVEIGSLTD